MIKTKPEEFAKFHKALMSNAPEGYIPWYFPVVKHNKAPDGYAISLKAPEEVETKGNWKASWALLSYENALKRLQKGHNVGIAALSNDPLIIIDIDDYIYVNQMPNTLIIKSRKRSGIHGFCWKRPEETKLPINIPTEHGEIRSSDQYVVSAGSYCETSQKDIEEENYPDLIKNTIKNDLDLGRYTVLNDNSPLFISFDDLPIIFKERKETIEKIKKEVVERKISPKIYQGKHSALFDLTINDVVPIQQGKREPHPLHSSDTGMNFSISDGLAHCWRHLVSLNALQFLAVKSGYSTCLEAGTGHKGSGSGESEIRGDYGAIFYAWLQAKKDGLISKNDPIPTNAMIYIAYKHKLFKKLPSFLYNKVIDIIEKEY